VEHIFDCYFDRTGAAALVFVNVSLCLCHESDTSRSFVAENDLGAFSDRRPVTTCTIPDVRMGG